ncbi:MAG: hypothetical protein MSG64_04450 [Pyrinomonadaceae bacterium MAG19_C2-C3]|nr:hypothetical protein [Pyrinomonadaceae bacterium MAG19_C2-C3]
MQAHKIEAVVQTDGTLTLEKLPFKKGDNVEVIILERHVKSESDTSNLLHGKLLRYDDPFGSATPLEDWEALK